MRILKSALKVTPANSANRAIVKHVKINDTPEIIERRVVDFAPWHKEFPVSGGDYLNAVDDPITKGYPDKSIRDYATARFAAIYLAGGKGLINGMADKDERDGSRVHKNGNRKNPISWLSESTPS